MQDENHRRLRRHQSASHYGLRAAPPCRRPAPHPQHANSGYPPLVVYYHRGAPVLVDEQGRRLDPRFLDAARRLGAWADFLVVTANAPICTHPKSSKPPGGRS